MVKVRREKVVVYKYRYFDSEVRMFKISKWYATEAVLRNGLGTAIPHTGLAVDWSEIENGIYKPKASERA